jgi:hypothetical protein
MRTANKPVRQSVTLPANVAAQVRSLAKQRWLSTNRMLVELIENGVEAEKRKQHDPPTWPSASAAPPTRMESLAWAINWAASYSATDEHDRELGQSGVISWV